MVSEKLLKVLACPISHRALIPAPQELLEKVNLQIQKKKCYTVSEQIVKSPLKQALYEPKSGILYRIEDDIPILLTEEAIQYQ